VRALTSNQLTEAQRAASAESLFPGMFDAHGWGFGVRVRVAPGPVEGPGWYGWDGGFGTTWFQEPSRGLIGIALTQSSDLLFNGGIDRFRAAVYDAAR
jgi:CubicO group peptidase (beta-lactamase class C family)